MEVKYSSKKIKDECTNEKNAIKKYGFLVGKKLIDLVIALEEATCLLDISVLPQYKLHPLKGNRINQYSLVIHKSSKYRIILYPYDINGHLIECQENEKKRLVSTIMVEISEVSEHYEK